MLIYLKPVNVVKTELAFIFAFISSTTKWTTFELILIIDFHSFTSFNFRQTEFIRRRDVCVCAFA